MYLYQHLLTSARNYLMCICLLWPSSRTRLLHVLIEAWFYQDLSIVHLFYRARRSEGKYTIGNKLFTLYQSNSSPPFKITNFHEVWYSYIHLLTRPLSVYLLFFWKNKWTWIYIKQVCPVNSVWTTYCKWLYKSCCFFT